MSSQKPSSTLGNEVRKASAEKKVSRTTGQPELDTTIAVRPPMMTTDETTEIA